VTEPLRITGKWQYFLRRYLYDSVGKDQSEFGWQLLLQTFRCLNGRADLFWSFQGLVVLEDPCVTLPFPSLQRTVLHMTY